MVDRYLNELNERMIFIGLINELIIDIFRFLTTYPAISFVAVLVGADLLLRWIAFGRVDSVAVDIWTFSFVDALARAFSKPNTTTILIMQMTMSLTR